MMDLTREEYNDERRQAAVLAIIRNSTLNAIAIRFRVRHMLKVVFQVMRNSGCGGKAATGHLVSAPPGEQISRGHASQPLINPGLRGTSAAEVLRKSLRRWRRALEHGVAEEGSFVYGRRRRPNLQELRVQISSDIADARRISSSVPARRSEGLGLTDAVAGFADAVNALAEDCSPNPGHVFGPVAESLPPVPRLEGAVRDPAVDDAGKQHRPYAELRCVATWHGFCDTAAAIRRISQC